MLKTPLIFFSVVLVVIVIIYYLKIKNKNKGRSRVHKSMQEKNEMNKDRVMKMFENRERIISRDVQATLLIEESETEEYLNDLIREMKIKRMGEGDIIYYIKAETEKKK